MVSAVGLASYFQIHRADAFHKDRLLTSNRKDVAIERSKSSEGRIIDGNMNVGSR